MADDQGKGAGKQALAPEVLAARAAEQRERDAAALAEREYDLARQSAAANADGNGHRRERGFGRGYYGPLPPQPQLDAGVADFAPPAPQSVMDTANAFAAVTQAMQAIAESLGSISMPKSATVTLRLRTIASFVPAKGKVGPSILKGSSRIYLAVYNIGGPTLPHIIATIFVLRYHEG